MSIVSGVIVHPVEIEDLQQIVPVTLWKIVGGQVLERKISGDIGVIVSAALYDSVPDDSGTFSWTVMSRTEINVWAKYKPVRYLFKDTTRNPNVHTQGWLDANMNWKTNSYVIWWRNSQNIYSETINTCGFAIPAASGVNQNIASQLGPWEYLRPRGLYYSEYYRLLDFNQYLHAAICPFEITELPTQAALLDSGKLSAKIRFRTPTVGALNLSLNDIFGQAGGAVYIGVAVVVGNAAYAITQDDNSFLISLEDLGDVYRGLAEGDVLTLVMFITRHKSITWTSGAYQVYSLDAPDIDFPVQGQCTVIKEKKNIYEIVISGLIGTDKSVLQPTNVELVNGWVRSDNSSATTPSRNYLISSVKCTINFVDADGNETLYDEVDYNPVGVDPEITVVPDYLEIGGGGAGYPNIDCTDAYGAVPQATDPLTYYKVTYTFIYEEEVSGE